MDKKVVIARCSKYSADEIRNVIVSMDAHLSLFENYIRPGMRVVLKPNMICAAEPDRQLTTHPIFIEGIIKVLKSYDVNLVISDSPAFGSLSGVAKHLGLIKIADKYNVPILEFKRPVKVKLGSKIAPGGIMLSRDALEADLIINLPKLKSHVQMMFSGAVKNFYGCVPGKRKVWYHFTTRHDMDLFCDMLLKIYNIFNKSISIVDGIVAMQGKGPRKGGSVAANMIMMSEDAVAIDTVLCSVLGVSDSVYPIVRMAKSLKVGVSDLNKIDIINMYSQESPSLDLKIPEELMDITFDLPRVIRSNIRHFFIKKIYEKLPWLR